MGCKACERRRKALAEKRRKKQEQGKPVQAAALGAVLAVSEAVGKALGVETEQAISDSYAGRVEALESVDALFDDGIHGEEPHVQDRDDARRNEGDQTSSGQP
jgi:hypothetical protein